MNTHARSIADLDAGTVLATVDIAAPPERVFRALADDVARWWGSPDTYQVTSYTADLRVGGTWRSEGTGADGTPFSVGGEFVEVDPPRKLVQTWAAAWVPGAPTRVTYTLEPIDGGTRVTVRHDGFGERRTACADHTRGWVRVLGWLTAFAAPPTERFFFVKLVAPRPTFMRDMTDAERAVMGKHVEYWRAHLDAGRAVVFGPVADPAGGWGLGVVRVADEAALQGYEAEDPAVRDLGMRYETLPMVRAVY